MKKKPKNLPVCPCGSDVPYGECCGRLLDGAIRADSAVTLMRSRYVAYALGREAYLLSTWHPATRPAALNLDQDSKWLGLQVLRHEQQSEDQAIVEFVARYKVNGRAWRLQETSRFVRDNGQWFYLQGEAS